MPFGDAWVAVVVAAGLLSPRNSSVAVHGEAAAVITLMAMIVVKARTKLYDGLRIDI